MKTTIFSALSRQAFAIIMFTALLIGGCKTNNDSKKSIVPPYESLNPEYKEYILKAELGDTLYIPSGTKIIVPASAFVDADGNIISGDVKIKYREFHNALDVFLSGIPMDIQSDGQKRDFQTAGMFEIRAEKEGRNLLLAGDKKVVVRFASGSADTDYNFFSYDESNGKWDFVDYVKPEPNTLKDSLLREIEKKRPAYTVPFSKEYFIYDYRAVIDVVFGNNWKKLNENWDNKSYKNKAEKYGLTVSNMKNNNDIVFNGVYYPVALMVWKNHSGKKIPAWCDGEWGNVTKISGNMYWLEVTDWETKKKYNAKVECIMPLKAMLAFSPDQWEEKYAEIMKKLAEEEERLRFEADVYRSFEVSQLGVYNYDRLYKIEKPIQVVPDFQLSENVGNEIYTIENVYIFTGDNKTLVKLSSDQWHLLALDAADTNYRMITVLPGNRVGIYSSEEYRKLNFKGLQDNPKSKVTFRFKVREQPLVSTDELKEIVGF